LIAATFLAMADAVSQQQNEEEQPHTETGEDELKKTSSYRYWVRSSSAPKTAPRPLTAEELKAHNNGNSNTVGSKWNQAGTWEEKSLSTWANGRVRELLPTVEPVEFDHDCTARVLEVTSCSGEASMVTVRQRKRIGYSFEIEMKYVVHLEPSSKPIEGKMKVPEACYGELDDLELEVTVSASDVKDSAKVKQTLTKLFLPKIRRKLEEFEAELKER
jgi:hypothetical protein